MSEKIDYSKGVYDAKKLGTGRMFILGVQHMFAMFVCRSGHAAVPPHHQKEGPGIPRLLLCVSGRLLHRGSHAG